MKETKKRRGRTKLHKTNHLVDRQKPTVHAPQGEPSSLISAKNDLLYCAFSLATHLCQLQVWWDWFLSHDMKHNPYSINLSCLLKAVVLKSKYILWWRFARKISQNQCLFHVNSNKATQCRVVCSMYI